MIARHSLRIFYGALIAAILAFGPPLAFLMLPAGAMFLLLLPIWSIGVLALLLLAFLVSGRFSHAIGVALLAGASLLSPFGHLAEKSVAVSHQTLKTNERLRAIDENCNASTVPLKKASARYGLLILDNIDVNGEQNYDIAGTVAALTGMRVFEIARYGPEAKFGKALETRPDRSNPCSGPQSSTIVGISSRGSQRSVKPVNVGMCLKTTEIPDPSNARTPAILLRDIRGGAANSCRLIEVVERTPSQDISLGRLHVNRFGRDIYPSLPALDGMPNGSWLITLLSHVLDQDLSDKALLQRAAVKSK